MTKYDLRNLCSMFEVDLEAALSCMNSGETWKAKHRLEEALKSLRKIKNHESEKKAKSLPSGPDYVIV